MTRATGFADSESTGIFGIAIGLSAGSAIR